MPFKSIWSEPERRPFPVKLNISPLNVEGLSSFSVPVELLKVTDAESAAPSSSVAPVPIVADPDVPVSGVLIRSVVLGAA